MSRRRAGISPSLFPFLAVLICTLGTLILLLALVAQQAHDAAVAQVEQEQQEQLATAKLAAPDASRNTADITLTAAAAERFINEGRFRVDELVSYRDEQTSELERKRDEIAHVESQIRKLKEKISQLNLEVEMAMADTNTPADAIAENEKTVVLMRAEAAQLRAEIAELESNDRGGKPRVVIVPHLGPNGTQRRPVYVLCTADGLQVMPEGAQISKSDALAAAKVDNPNTNPLGAALRVARLHAMQQYGDQVPPYPLLIVRPDGIYMYRVASALMKDWDDQYGYELVPSEVDLAFPGGDKVLREEMELAIQQSVARNVALVSGLGGGLGRGGSGGADGGNGSPGSLPGNQFASTTATASGGDDYAAGNGAGELPRAGTGGGAASNQPARELPILSARDLDRQSQSNGFSLARDQRFRNPADSYAAATGNRNGPYDATGSLETQSDALNDFLQGKKPPGLNDGDPSSGDENGVSAADLASDSTDGSPADSSTTEGTTSGQAGSAGQSSSTPPAGSSSANGMNSIAMTLREPGQSGSASASPGQPGTSSSPSDSPSATSQSQSPQAAQVAQQMVRREGKDWAMPEAFRGMGGTEFVRSISMRCHHDRYELIEQGRVVQTFPFGQEGVYRPTLQLATAIRDRVQAWGATMQGGYWKPQLEVSVGPHAEPRFHELQTLMQDSGVDVVRRSP